MSSLSCDNCTEVNTSMPNGICNICHFPIEGSLLHKRTYRNQLSDVKYNLKKLNTLYQAFLRTASYAIIFGLPWFVLTVLFSPTNMNRIILLTVVVVFFFGISWMINLMILRNIWIVGIIYFVFTIIEFSIYGVPNTFIPNQNIGDKTIILFAIINTIGPILYIALRIALLTPLVLGIQYHNKISKTPESIIHYAITTI